MACGPGDASPHPAILDLSVYLLQHLCSAAWETLCKVLPVKAAVKRLPMRLSALLQFLRFYSFRDSAVSTLLRLLRFYGFFASAVSAILRFLRFYGFRDSTVPALPCRVFREILINVSLVLRTFIRSRCRSNITCISISLCMNLCK